MSERIEITVHITAKPGREAELRQRLQALVAETVKEPGCVQFDIFEEREAPGRFVLWEVFADQTAFRAHLDTEYTKAYFGVAGELVERSQSHKHKRI